MYKRGDKIRFRERGSSEILHGEIEIRGSSVFGVIDDDGNRYIVKKHQIFYSKYQEQKSELNI